MDQIYKELNLHEKELEWSPKWFKWLLVGIWEMMKEDRVSLEEFCREKAL